ncbi:MAG: DnaT-like ssDNA-binding domain-containing protein [Pseudomonadota bacterium]
MTDSSLVPERQLLFSPGLASTIGLNEAIMVQHLQGLLTHRQAKIRDGRAWLSIERAFLLQTLPFWSLEDLQRISRSLVDKGVILVSSPPLGESAYLTFALNETVAAVAQNPQHHGQQSPASHSQSLGDARRSAVLLPSDWQPSEDLLALLSLNNRISREFALSQLEDFVFYWRERGEVSHAWENKFRQHVISKWRHQQQHEAEAFRQPTPTTLDSDWHPSEDAMEIMARANIDRDFIEEAIPEFILYWRERGAAPRELNSKFIQHIRLQWARYSSSLEHSTHPKRIASDWEPGGDVYDILRLSHIDVEFARSLLPEFILYWRDSNQTHTSWNSKFLQHVKFHWAKRHQLEKAGLQHVEQRGSHPAGRTRDRSLQDDLTDTSWAE